MEIRNGITRLPRGWRYEQWRLQFDLELGSWMTRPTRSRYDVVGVGSVGRRRATQSAGCVARASQYRVATGGSPNRRAAATRILTKTRTRASGSARNVSRAKQPPPASAAADATSESVADGTARFQRISGSRLFALGAACAASGAVSKMATGVESAQGRIRRRINLRQRPNKVFGRREQGDSEKTSGIGGRLVERGSTWNGKCGVATGDRAGRRVQRD